MATDAVRWLAAEASAGENASATTYSRAGNIGILAVVVSELKLRQIQRQIFSCSHCGRCPFSKLQKTHCCWYALCRARTPTPSDQHAHAEMPGRAFDSQRPHRSRPDRLFRRRPYRQTATGFNRGVLDNLASEVALAGNRADDRSLADRSDRCTGAVAMIPRCSKSLSMPPMGSWISTNGRANPTIANSASHRQTSKRGLSQYI
jgi:hypothetical protein